MPLRRLPLFPLPLVLLPGVPLPLHIFEPRYRRLLADCLAGDRSFGIVYLPAGRPEQELESGRAGCVAVIDEHVMLPDGRSNILVTGSERFLLADLVDDPAPYHVANVSVAPDLPDEPAHLAIAAERLRDLFTRVGRAARVLAEEQAPLPELPDDPGLLSFRVAGVIDLEADVRQRLLAERSPLSRLEELSELLGRAVEPLERRASVHARARTNGAGPSL